MSRLHHFTRLDSEVVHTINRLSEGALDHDRRTALQVRALLSLIASEVI